MCVAVAVVVLILRWLKPNLVFFVLLHWLPASQGLCQLTETLRRIQPGEHFYASLLPPGRTPPSCLQCILQHAFVLQGSTGRCCFVVSHGALLQRSSQEQERRLARKAQCRGCAGRPGIGNQRVKHKIQTNIIEMLSSYVRSIRVNERCNTK